MKRKLSYCYCTWFYVGLLPKAPGTFGTLAAIPLWYFMHGIHVFWYIIFVIFMFSFGVIAANEIESSEKVSDPSYIVIDEVVGFLVAAINVNNWLHLVWAFILFRLLDIFKPWPICWLERKIDSGLGVMLDDILAGIATYLILTGFLPS